MNFFLLVMPIINLFCSIIRTIILILISIAFFTLLERKVLGYSHLRIGPNKVSLMGLIQPIADAIKLFLKQILLPTSSNKAPFFYIPGFTLFLALRLWRLYPFYPNPNNFKLGVLLFLRISRVNVYSTLLAGWTRNSKYSLIGALRGRAQTISYEVSLFIILFIPLLCLNRINLDLFYSSVRTVTLFYPIFLMWLASILAETNRTPFDLAEGESELVSGFNTEYGSGPFALIFMAEYINILFFSLLSSLVFLNFSLERTKLINPFIIILFTLFISLFFIWARTSFPRIRYDQLIYLCWKVFLPLVIRLILTFITLSFIAFY